jgi:predicted Fe-Mo cluster-binding NifX family protein
MKIAIPLVGGKLSPHFGHCENFAFIDVDRAGGKILQRTDVGAPPHQPGLLPGWLRERGVDMILAGGMGGRAQEFFGQMGIDVVLGAPSDEPEKIVLAWMEGNLILGPNVCDH